MDRQAERPSARCVSRAARGVTRSESRKRIRRSVSPEGKSKANHLQKKLKNNSTGEKGQTKITAFSQSQDNNTLESNTPQTENTNMASNNTQFAQLMEQFGIMSTKLDQTKQELNEKLDQHILKMDERIEKIKGKFLEVENKVDRTETDIKNLGQKIENNAERITENNHAANLAMSHAERNEQYQRNFNLRIFNLPESINESMQECEDKVLALFSEKLGVKIPIEAIDVLHRLGPKSKQSKLNSSKESALNNAASSDANRNQNETGEDDDTRSNSSKTSAEENMETASSDTSNLLPIARPVIVSFVSRRVRREILLNRHKLKKQDNQTTAPVFVTEDLTKYRHSLFSKARENKEKFQKVWSREGRIFGRQLNGIDVPIDSFFDITCPPVPKKQNQRFFSSLAPSRGGRGAFNRGRGRFHYTQHYGRSRVGDHPPRDPTPDRIENLD